MKKELPSGMPKEKEPGKYKWLMKGLAITITGTANVCRIKGYFAPRCGVFCERNSWQVITVRPVSKIALRYTRYPNKNQFCPVQFYILCSIFANAVYHSIFWFQF
jgi:hypothetical protein